jgi:aspartate racemase
MKTIGMLGGMSWESTAVYYKLLNEGARLRLGGLHSAPLLLKSYDFAPIAAEQAAGDWESLGRRLAEDAQRLEQAGAALLILCTNTMHLLYERIAEAVAIPVLHIADAAAAAIKRAACRRPILLGTRFTMEGRFYRERLRQQHGLDALIPDEAGIGTVHDIIYNELCRGIIAPESRARYLAVIDALKAEGGDSVILGCTEIGLLIGPHDLDLPVFDTTALHVEAALDAAMPAPA